MKREKISTIVVLALLWSLSFGTAFAQSINVSAGFVNYDLAEYPGYPYGGTFTGSVYKTSGTIPANTVVVTFTLVPEVPWNGDVSQITIPPGWAFDPSVSTTDILRFYNNVDWLDTADDPVWTIPVTAVAPRTETELKVHTSILKTGGAWTDPNPNDTETSSAVTVLDVPLPVKLVSFTATAESSIARLDWSTTEEVNSDRFEIERSGNGKAWTKIGEVRSHGESAVKRDYAFTDEQPAQGQNLYRLKMVDKDATFAYSRIQSLQFEHVSESKLYPNPAKEELFIDATNVRSVKIINANGIAAFSSDKPVRYINTKGFTAGMYIVQITHMDGRMTSRKVVIAN